MRLMGGRAGRGTALVAIALTGALSLAGCARDSGSDSASDGGGDGCETTEAPAAGDGPASTSEVVPEGVDASALRPGLAFDIGGRGDNSFNDSAAAGLDRAIEELGVREDSIRELTAGASESEAAQQARLRQLATEGFNPVIAVGFAYQPALAVVAPEFPDTQFAIVDDDQIEADNVTPLVFAEEQGSFLVGVVAALKSQSCHIGFVGGVDQPLIQKFEAGFIAGAQAVAPDIEIERDYLSPAGDFTGFQDPARGQEVAQGQIDAGADVLYHAAGASGSGVFAAASDGGAQAIGVDSDQYNQETLAEYQDVIITSMLKRVDVAVYDYLAAIATGDTSGLPERFDLSVDGVGYSTSGGQIDDITDVVDAYRAQIISGDIEVPTTPED